ncbi:amidohydrolase [Streptosporangium sp. NPDC002607]
MNEKPADLVLIDGPVFTADAARSWTDAVAVRQGRIVALGAPAVRELIGRTTEVVDLAGTLTIPGFVDAHAHPVFGGLGRARCDLLAGEGNLAAPASAGAAETLARVAAYAAAHPGRPWVVGGGWSMDHFPGGTPRREDLDRVVPDRPVFLLNRDGHGAWVNSRALELAGVDRHTSDPPDGRIERDPDGTPTGTLHENAAELVSRLLPAVSPEEYAQALMEGQRHLHSLGVTGWQDALVGDYLSYPDALETYRAAAADGRLTARVVGALWWDRDAGVAQLDDLVRRRATSTVGRFAATSVKIMQDGVCENFTAALLEPYRSPGGAGERRGHSYLDPGALGEAVRLLDAEGFQIHFHTIGDRAVREALDAIEGARGRTADPEPSRGRGHRGDNRHHLAHLQLVHPDDVPRLRRLRVAANMQALWAVRDEQMAELTIPFLGEERSRRQYAFGALREAGVTMVAGSDWPVSSANPLWGIHGAVNRLIPGDREGEPFLPEQRLALADALSAYTAGGAWINHLDHLTGTIAVGKYADLAVLDRDPFEEPAHEVADARVDLTFVEGVLVHERTSR